MLNLNQVQEQITQAKFEDTSPLAHGWVFAYRNKKLGNQPVFTQGDAKLMYHLGYSCWYYSINDGDAKPIKGTIQKITEDILRENK